MHLRRDANETTAKPCDGSAVHSDPVGQTCHSLTASRRNHMLDIGAAKIALKRYIKCGRVHELRMYQNFRDAGLTWTDICAWLDDPTQHGGKRLSAYKWAQKLTNWQAVAGRT